MSTANPAMTRAARGDRPPTPPLPEGLKRWTGPTRLGVPAKVFTRDCPAAAKDIVALLASCGPDYHYYRHVDLGTIEAETGYGERMVKTAMAWLKAEGIACVSRWKRPGSRRAETIVWLAWKLPDCEQPLAIVDDAGRRPAAPSRPRPRPAPGATNCTATPEATDVATSRPPMDCTAPVKSTAPTLLLGNLEFEKGTKDVQVRPRHACSVSGEMPPGPASPRPSEVDTEEAKQALVMSAYRGLQDSEREAIRAEALRDVPASQHRFTYRVDAAIAAVMARRRPELVPTVVPRRAAAILKATPPPTVAERIAALGPDTTDDEISGLAREASSSRELADNPRFFRRTCRAFRLAKQEKLSARVLADGYQAIMRQPVGERGSSWGSFLKDEYARCKIEPAPWTRQTEKPNPSTSAGGGGPIVLAAKLFRSNPPAQ